MRIQTFAVIISILSGLAFLISTVTPIIIDPMIFNLINRRLPAYPIGLFITIFTLPVAFTAYLVNRHAMFRKHRALSTAAIMVSSTFLSLLNYPTEFGIHTFVMGSGLAYAFVIGLLVASFNYEPQLKTDSQEVHYRARIERIRLEYESWFRGILALSAFVVVPAGILVFSAYGLGLDMYATEGVITQEVIQASFLFTSAMWIAAFYFGVLVIAFLWMALKKIRNLLNELNEIKSVKK